MGTAFKMRFNALSKAFKAGDSSTALIAAAAAGCDKTVGKQARKKRKGSVSIEPALVL